MKTKIGLPILLAIIFSISIPCQSQSKKKLKNTYENVEVYVGIEKYENGVEKKQKAININTETGSYAYIVIRHPYRFRLPGGEYTYKVYRKQGRKYKLHGTHQSFFEGASELRGKITFYNTGSFLIKVYKGKDFKIGEVPLVINAMTRY